MCVSFLHSGVSVLSSSKAIKNRVANCMRIKLHVQSTIIYWYYVSSQVVARNSITRGKMKNDATPNCSIYFEHIASRSKDFDFFLTYSRITAIRVH